MTSTILELSQEFSPRGNALLRDELIAAVACEADACLRLVQPEPRIGGEGDQRFFGTLSVGLRHTAH